MDVGKPFWGPAIQPDYLLTDIEVVKTPSIPSTLISSHTLLALAFPEYPSFKTPNLLWSCPRASSKSLSKKTRNFMRGVISTATVRAYKSDFADFSRFCRDHNLPSLPATPTTVAVYISVRASVLSNATITRRLTAITKAHQAFGCKDSPASSHNFIVSETLKGIRRAIGTAQHGKDALMTSDIRKMIDHCPRGFQGLRDRALAR